MMEKLAKKTHHIQSVHGSGILAPGISKLFVITSTLKKHPEEVKARFN
jgi:hypothetical protein